MNEAASRLDESLRSAGARAGAVQTRFAASWPALAGERRAIRILSLLPELEAARSDWPAAEQRLTSECEALAGADPDAVFLCTVFRHVPRQFEAGERIALRQVIRRLNDLAARLSHAYGINVVDLDRALAHIGAVHLPADFRLEGEGAAKAAGREIAGAILAAGLDDWIAPELQDRAARALAAT